MGGIQRPRAGSAARGSMRPPPKPAGPQQTSVTGRAPSPAGSVMSGNTSSGTGLKRKERDYEQDRGEEATATTTNIHVVVRCRGRSEREVRENSGVVVSTNGVKGKTVELSMGPNAINNKTYHFDKVFSPAADQAIIFDDVVSPILNEMLTGYNCTIFAYGQTGTGKTYTMSGDMTDTLGLLSDAAGIIPRVLYSLFQKLESEELECSVKCSFIELYNEELRDLLSADENVKLKMYDDSNRKCHSATVVHGMEESHIKSAAAGIKLLQKGSYRRQVAATKCNDLSSRSHTVFTITTYVKKPGDTGEDFICSGKLNLVDLAGSENIQRSGAENKRAVEAGLINKSLLTLGRVINALVDKGSHIPYRESKLTRLLQDSLGGRTKTCIIATVSPAKSNLEETISTLDYAFRAKNIRNKPQVNSVISKKTLLKEFTAEIEKLKSELIATRQRNGVYMTNEQYEEITVESESRRILSEEQKARIETMEVSLRNKVQELFSLTNNFTLLKKDNENTRAALESTKDVLVQTELVLQDTRQTLSEERTLREAHEATEGKLYGLGTELISTLGTSVNDLNGLHEKLRRRSNLHHRNRESWQTTVGHVVDVSQAVDSRIDVFRAAHVGMVSDTSARIQSFVSAERAKLDQWADLLISKTSTLGELKVAVEAQSSEARDSMNDVLEEIKVLREEVKEKVGEGLHGLSQAAAKISGEVMTELELFHAQLHASYSGLGKDFKAIFEDMSRDLATQRDEADRLRAALQAAHRENREATLTASTQLQSALEEERQAAQQEREKVKEQILQLIDVSAARQDERLSKALTSTQTHLVEASESFEAADQAFGEGMDRWTAQDSALMSRLIKSKEELKGRMKNDWTAIDSHNTAIQTSTKSVHEETVKIVDAQLSQMATQMAALDEFVTRARSENDRHHDQRVQSLGDMSSGVQEAFALLGQDIQTRHTNFVTFTSQHQADASGLVEAVCAFEQEVRAPLRELKNETSRSVLAEYVPTGETPLKREWKFPTTLPRTENHESMVARLRGQPDPALGSKTPSSARTPARSPRKHASPKKTVSPSKLSSPTKAKIYTDAVDEPHSQPPSALTHAEASVNQGEAAKTGLKEIDINLVLPRPAPSTEEKELAVIDFARSVGSGLPPPLKRHATANAVAGESKLRMKSRRAKSTIIDAGVENLSQGMGVGVGRRLRSSPRE